MCGIAGYFGTETIAPERVEACLGAMHRRGPDAVGQAHFETRDGRHVHLLHTRLSIIDLDPRSNQPFRIGEKTIVFNGELYNYLEMRRLIETAGRSFRTQSDTEVLLAAVEELGWGALDRMEGMWAFAVYDERDESLTLCRDRFGEKPLYLLRDATGIFFGSEPKFLFALAGRRPAANRAQILRFLVHGYKTLYKREQTFFEGLEEVPPACLTSISRTGTERRSRYWTPLYKPQEGMSWNDAVQGARERLIRAVELRLRADVPLAFCMSGGVDSNSLLSIARREFGYDVHGFTILNTDSRYEEQDMVQYAVDRLGIRHTWIPVDTSGFLPKLRLLIRYHDSPVSTITYFAHSLLMAAVKSHGYRISISGTAADELFTGYYDHHLAYLAETRDAAAVGAWDRHVRPLVRNPFLRDPDLFLRYPNFRGHITLGEEQFRQALQVPFDEVFEETQYASSLLRNRMLNEMFHENIPVILHEDDLNAMYYSIENRSPFLDRNLFEFCFTIPTRHLIRNGCAKAVLRAAMRGIVPARILDNPRKVGFNAPIFSFLDVRDPQVRAELLDQSPIFELVRRSAIEELLSKPDLPNSQSKFLFSFLSSKMFLEELTA